MIAEGLGEYGARVVITARKKLQLEEAVDRLSAAGIPVHAAVCDVSQPDSIGPLVEDALSAFGAIDVLVNNAGTNWLAPAEDYPDKGWDRVMDLSARGSFFLAREVGRRAMIPRRSGSIINIGSSAGVQGNGTTHPGGGHWIGYHAAKGALNAWTKGLAVEWGEHNIRVNCICPGWFETEGNESIRSGVGSGAAEFTPLRRFGRADDLKGVAVFLASDASAFVTGQVLLVDGGFSAN